MKERPILFSGPMVRAILEGRKTQTRRVINPHPADDVRPYNLPNPAAHAWISSVRHKYGPQTVHTCPFGRPGERLWVRENGWERPERTPKMMREGADTWAPYYFDADPWTPDDHADFKKWGFKRRPSIHMPRSASRITLEVTGVRVERLQDISTADALAEGETGRDGYRLLWDSLNAARGFGWDTNPWVWVVEFKR